MKRFVTENRISLLCTVMLAAVFAASAAIGTLML